MKVQRLIELAALVSMALLIPVVAGGVPPVVQALSPSYIPFADPNAGWEEVGSGSASGSISDNSGELVLPFAGHCAGR